jgi:putative redox protein
MDVRKESGGDGTAPSPMELVLMALGGCSGVDVAEILRKKRLQIRDFQILLEGERAEEYPKVFTKVQMTFVFEGEDLKLKPLEDAVRLSLEKYCSVAGMVGKTAEIEWKVEIKE